MSSNKTTVKASTKASTKASKDAAKDAAEVARKFLDSPGAKYSQELTAMMLKQGADINLICKAVKSYQIQYLFIEKESPELARTFDHYTWWRCQSWYKEE